MQRWNSPRQPVWDSLKDMSSSRAFIPLIFGQKELHPPMFLQSVPLEQDRWETLDNDF